MVKVYFGYWNRKGKDIPSKTHIFYHEDDTEALCGLGEDIVIGVHPASDLCRQCIVRIHPFADRQAVEDEWRRQLAETEDERT